MARGPDGLVGLPLGVGAAEQALSATITIESTIAEITGTSFFIGVSSPQPRARMLLAG